MACQNKTPQTFSIRHIATSVSIVLFSALVFLWNSLLPSYFKLDLILVLRRAFQTTLYLFKII